MDIPDSLQSFLPTSSARHIIIDEITPLAELVEPFNFQVPQRVICLVGGINIDPFYVPAIRRFFGQVLAPIAETHNSLIITGGTKCGIFEMIGQARQDIGGTFPLIGVLPAAILLSPHPSSLQLEPNHTHFVFTPGNDWGHESPWLAKIATLLSGDGEKGSITVLVNGGDVAWLDVIASLTAERKVLVVKGTGRTADILAGEVEDVGAREGKKTSLAGAFERVGLLTVLDIDESMKLSTMSVLRLLGLGAILESRQVQ